MGGKLDGTDTQVLEWASAPAAGDLVQPDSIQASSGWVNLEKPTHNEMNALIRHASCCKPEYEDPPAAAGSMAAGEVGIVQVDDTSEIYLETNFNMVDGGGADSVLSVAADGEQVYWLMSNQDLIATDHEGNVAWTNTTDVVAGVEVVADGRFVYVLDALTIRNFVRTTGVQNNTVVETGTINRIKADGEHVFACGAMTTGGTTHIERFDADTLVSAGGVNLGVAVVDVWPSNPDCFAITATTLRHLSYDLSGSGAAVFTAPGTVQLIRILVTATLVIIGKSPDTGSEGNLLAFGRRVGGHLTPILRPSTVWDNTDNAYDGATSMTAPTSMAWDGGNLLFTVHVGNAPYRALQVHRVDNGALVATLESASGGDTFTGVDSDGFYVYVATDFTTAQAGFRKNLKKGPVMVRREDPTDSRKGYNWHKLYTLPQPW